MSNLENYKNIINELQAEKSRLAENQQVPLNELRELVFVSYACSMITIGRASELLCLDLLDFREQWNYWAQENPRMLAIFESYNP